MARTRSQTIRARNSGVLPHLLHLPVELQLSIYELVLLFPTPIEITIQHSWQRSKKPPRRPISPKRQRSSVSPAQPALSRVCKLLRPIALKIYYSGNTFHIKDKVALYDTAFLRAWISHHVEQKDRQYTRHLPIESSLDLTAPNSWTAERPNDSVCILSSKTDVGLVSRMWLHVLPDEREIVVGREVRPWQMRFLDSESVERPRPGCACEITISCDVMESKVWTADGKRMARKMRANARRLAWGIGRVLRPNEGSYRGRCEECGLMRRWECTVAEGGEHSRSMG